MIFLLKVHEQKNPLQLSMKLTQLGEKIEDVIELMFFSKIPLEENE